MPKPKWPEFAQAFEDGYEEGRQFGEREVVEWINFNCQTEGMSEEFRFKWQAKLKEWGIDDK